MRDKRANIVAETIPDQPSGLCLCFEGYLEFSLNFFGEFGNGKHELGQYVWFTKRKARQGTAPSPKYFTPSKHFFFFLPEATDQIAFEELNITQLEKRLCQFPEDF